MNDDAATFAVPRLTTPRLLLRELRTSDFEAYAESAADPVAMKYMTSAIDRRTAWRMFTSLMGGWIVTGAGWWGIELRATGELVGTVGGFYRETNYALGHEADLELGWTVFRAHWRKGIATEAARAALAYGVERHRPRRAIAIIDPANVGSIGVAKAIGMTFDGDMDFYGEPSVRYATHPAT